MARAKQGTSGGAVIRECLGLRIKLANRVITKIYEDALRPFGLRATQLAMLAFAEERGQLRQSDICADLQLDDSTLSRNLERMQAKGWLEATVGADARERPYQLTREGRSLLQQAIPAWRVAQKRVQEMLEESEVETLHALAKRCGLQA